MTHFLALEPLEFLLRYNVLAGMVVAIIGTAICMIGKWNLENLQSKLAIV